MAPIIIASLIILAVYVGTKRLSGIQMLCVAILAILGITLAIFPDLSSFVANALHVGRGTDLILYVAVLAGLFIASNFYFRFKRNEQMLIALARQSAIAKAKEPRGGTRSASGGEGGIEQIQEDLNRVEP